MRRDGIGVGHRIHILDRGNYLACKVSCRVVSQPLNQIAYSAKQNENGTCYVMGMGVAGQSFVARNCLLFRFIADSLQRLLPCGTQYPIENGFSDKSFFVRFFVDWNGCSIFVLRFEQL